MPGNMYKLLVLFTFITVFPASGQESWKQCWTMPLSEESAWDADPSGNVYLYNNESISKLDSTGKLLLTQSAKSIGTIEKIDASNRLKIAVFSEEQQQVCYLDNALALQSDCIDLTAAGIGLAQHFATSVQTDRIWIYDQLNSELQLVTLRGNQRQTVQNLRSLLEIGMVTQLFEFNNVLYLVDNLGQVATFDNFGTFLSGFTLSAGYVQAFGKGVLYSMAGSIFARAAESDKETPFFAGSEPIRCFHFAANRLYISTATSLTCFQLLS
jgi:hypothetical protein